MKKKSIFLFFLVTLNHFAQGYEHYTVEQGLPSNRIYKILQDYDGFIWIATDKGLSKFDGSSFKNFTIASGLSSNDIWEMFLTGDNKIWYLTISNRLGYIKNDSVYTFKTQNNVLLYPSIFSTDLKSLILNNTAEEYGKNYRLANGQWQKIPEPPALRPYKPAVLIHPVYYFSYLNEAENTFFFTDSLGHHVTKVKWPYKDTYFKGQINDSLAAFTSKNGVHFFNLNTGKTHHIINPEFFKENIFIRILATGDEVQISTENFWAKLGKDYRLTDIKTFPEKFHLTTVFKDREGNFWGTTFAEGVYFFPKNALSSQNFFTGKPVQFIKFSGNNLFTAILNKGIYKYNPVSNKFEKFLEHNEYFFDIYYIDNDNFAVVTTKTIFIKKHGKLTEYFSSGKGILPLENNLFALRERNGISLYDGNTIKLLKTYPVKGTNDFTTYNNHIVSGTPVGIFTIKNDSVKQIPIDRNIPEIPVLSLAKTSRHLIVGTEGYGAFIWDGKNNMKPVKDTDDLIVNDIFTKNDSIWLATQKGVFNYSYDKNVWRLNRIYRKSDGIVSNRVNYVAVFNGKIFTSNYSNITSVNKNTVKQIPFQKLYFKSVEYNGKKIHDNQRISYTKNNNLLVNFGMIDFSGQVNNRYFYQLLPVQNNWIETGSKDINFNDLKPDNYIFNLKTVNPYGQESSKSFRFVITPLWWQTLAVKILSVILLAFIIFLIAYYYRRKALIKQRNKLLAQKQIAEFELHALRSQMNPHFVFNSLNAILYYINDENYDQSESYLIKFSRLIRMIFEFSRKKEITIRQEIELLKSYLNLEKMRFPEKLDYCIHTDPEINIDKVTIPTLLLQPIVENAVNHGIFHKKSKGTVCIEFRYIDENSYEVLIKDDGIGIKKSAEINKKSLKKHQSRSTQILMDRIKLLNTSGKWQIVYELKDETDNEQITYNTIVNLKITKL